MTDILVVGDAFVDRWLTVGGVRMSAERAGLPIYDISTERQQRGGAANVAHALTRLIGDGTIKVNDRLLAQPGECPIKTRLVMDGIQVCRFDIHDNALPIRVPERLIGPETVVVVSDYCKGSINGPTLQAIAASPAKQIWINTKSIQPWYQHLDMERGARRLRWTCNASEWAKDREFYDQERVVYVTKAEEGIELREFGKVVDRVGIWPGPVVSVCGAGDVVLAALVTVPDGPYPMGWAMAAAKVAVGRPFTYCPTKDEVAEEYYG